MVGKEIRNGVTPEVDNGALPVYVRRLSPKRDVNDEIL
jgi:hypothetical protein